MSALPSTGLALEAPLTCERVGKSYGTDRVLRDLHVQLERGEVLGLIGRNGAGKTTLIRILLGLLQPDQGSARVFGEPSLTLSDGAKARIGYVPQGRRLFAGMSVADNLALGRLKRTAGEGIRWDDERITTVFPRLKERWHTPADYLSGGEQQMVAVARALAGNVRALLLDEPFEGLSPAITEELFEAFDRLRSELAIVIVDHHLELALALSDRTVVLERGSVTWIGQSRVLREDLTLRRKVLWL